ncbi:MAG: response regulator, partial [Spirochaetales bacterium]|nr:response regulator [Spirochaetales bacterium]
MITGSIDEEVFDGSESDGLAAVLTKPATASRILDCVMEALGKKKAMPVYGKAEEERNRILLAPVYGARILLVEDNEINQQVAEEILSEAGFIVDIADNGQIGVEMVEASQSSSPNKSQSAYQIVLMDIQMPELDGYAAARKIRASHSYASLPIVAMTANAMASDRLKSTEAGMNDHIPKPIDTQVLFEALAKWIPQTGYVAVARAPISADKSSSASKTVLPILDAGIPGIDKETALKRLGGKESLLADLLVKFVRDFSQTAEQIRESLGSGEYETAQ